MTQETPELARSIALYSKHAGSDKEYHVWLRPKGTAWTVDYAHAGRGKPLKPGTKTETPVDYSKAVKIFDRLVNEKKNADSHYTEGEAGTEYEGITSGKELFGIFPQQPTAIDRRKLESLIAASDWGFQLKANGENRLFGINDCGARGGNKKGQVVSVPKKWIAEFRALGSFIANGEHVGDRFMAFDLLECEGVDLRPLPQRLRYAKLLQLYDGMSNVVPSFGVIECYYGADEKRNLLRHAQETNLEGIVAKCASAAYNEGRGTDTLKHVFREVSTCIVMARNVQRSVQVGLLNAAGELQSCGNVTIPPNKPVPEVGDLVDVLYMYFNGRAFEIPVYDPDNKSPRRDVDRCECTFEQVSRYKPDDQDVDPDGFRRPQDESVEAAFI